MDEYETPIDFEAPLHVSKLAGSADQRQWQRIARRLRAELMAHLNDVGCMKPDEMQSLISALESALDFMVNANTFDARIEFLEQNYTRPIW